MILCCRRSRRRASGGRSRDGGGGGEQEVSLHGEGDGEAGDERRLRPHVRLRWHPPPHSSERQDGPVSVIGDGDGCHCAPTAVASHRLCSLLSVNEGFHGLFLAFVWLIICLMSNTFTLSLKFLTFFCVSLAYFWLNAKYSLSVLMIF